MKRVASWYRYHCTKARGNKLNIDNPLSPLALFQQRHGAPRRKQVRHVYSQLHYETNVKPALHAELDRMKQAAQSEPIVNTIRRITKSCWDNEDDDFRREISLAVEDLHKEASATYLAYMDELAGEDFIAE